MRVFTVGPASPLLSTIAVVADGTFYEPGAASHFLGRRDLQLLMSSSPALRHLAVAAIAAVTVLANLALGVAWWLALLAGAAVLLFGELSPRLLRARPPAAVQPTASDAEPGPPGSTR